MAPRTMEPWTQEQVRKFRNTWPAEMPANTDIFHNVGEQKPPRSRLDSKCDMSRLVPRLVGVRMLDFEPRNGLRQNSVARAGALGGEVEIMSTLGVVEEILRRTGVPMSVREVVEKAGERLPTKSKTPDTVVARDLSMDIKKKGESSLFIRTSPGRYTMRDFVTAREEAPEFDASQSAVSSSLPDSQPEPQPILSSALNQDRAATLASSSSSASSAAASAAVSAAASSVGTGVSVAPAAPAGGREDEPSVIRGG